MDSNTKSEDSANKHVLDYYKKYSQNKELPKYFSGTSLTYLPEIKDIGNLETELKTLVQTDINIIGTSVEANEESENVEEPVDTSRASSAMSNRRLEWDNGADIGYDNCQEKRLRKSLSLPVIADLTQKKSDVDFGSVVSNPAATTSRSSNSEGNVKVILLPCSSSSEYHSDDNADLYPTQYKKVHTSSSSSNNNFGALEKNTAASSSSSDSSNKQSLKQFASTLSYLKQKIGMPDAHSTPKYMDGQHNNSEGHSSRPVLKKSSGNTEEEKSTSKSPDNLKQFNSKQIDKKFPKSSILKLASIDTKEEELEYKNKHQHLKIVNLAVTKPITVECTCSTQSLTHKALQTVTTRSTIAVQTDEITEQELDQIIQTCQKSNNQSLIYFEYSESDKTNACSTQTNSDIVESNCESFEYLSKGSLHVKNELSQKASNVDIQSETSNEADLVSHEKECTTNLKRTQNTHDLRINSQENSEQSSNECCLGNLVSSGLLNKTEEDIGKSIYLLQRLLKSKKYDAVTKKRYIKKIIKKITESKYLEESSTSSDLFVPKKLLKTGEDTGSSLSGDEIKKNSIESNVPWYPAATEQLKLTPKRKKLVQKTTTHAFLPQRYSSKEELSSAPKIVPVNSRDTRKNRFTFTNNEYSVNHRYGTNVNKNKSDKIVSETDSTSMEKHYESSSTQNSYQNWKDDKTLSEKVLEKQSPKSHSSNGNGDCLVKFADKERQFQISWINNEISHLGKLKGLLEKPLSQHSKSMDPVSIKKNTNVYVVSNENGTNMKPKRNYVIETVLGAQGTSEMNFKLNGQVYTVQESSNSKKKKQSKKPRHVTGNIEVVSSDSTTNIKVTTFCGDCKRFPCICISQASEDGCTCGLGIGEKCSSKTCCCRSEISTENVPATLPDKTIGRNCEKLGCICVTTSSSETYNDCVCCICKKIPCICDIKYNKSRKTPLNSEDEMSGTFIPVIPTKVKFSTFPMSKEDGRKSAISCFKCEKTLCICGSNDIIDKITSTISKSVASKKDEASSYESLRKVFENCACTQTNCSCDFVEKLLNCFSKVEIPGSTISDIKYKRTEKPTLQWNNQSVGLQAHVNTENQKEQTTTVIADNKALQTESIVKDEGQTIQPSVGSAVAQRDVLDLQDIGIQTKADVRDKILQTSQSNVEKKFQSRGVTFDDKILRSIDTFSDNFVKKSHTDKFQGVNQDASASATVPSVKNVGTSLGTVTKQRGTSASPVVHSIGTFLENVKTDQEQTSSLPVHSTPMNNVGAFSGYDLKKQKGLIDLPILNSVATSSNDLKIQKDATTLPHHFHNIIEQKDTPVLRSDHTLSRSHSFDNIRKDDNTAQLQTLQSINPSPESSHKPVQQRRRSSSASPILEAIRKFRDHHKPPSVHFSDRSNDENEEVAKLETLIEISLNGIKKDQKTTGSQTIYTFDPSDSKKQHDTDSLRKAYSTSTGPSLENTRKQKDAATSPKVKLVDVTKQQETTASQTRDSKFVQSPNSESSQPTSSKSSESTDQKEKTVCVCCCTQTESKSRHRQGDRAKIQGESSGKDSGKGKKHNSGSVATSSTMYDICPSILVSSYNDTSQSVTEESSSKSTQATCVCCNRKYPIGQISVLGNEEEMYPLCRNCLAKRPILTAVCYAGPEESCPCSKPPSYLATTKTDVSDESKKTTTDSNDPEEYCTCTKPFRLKNSRYCSYCQFKLRNTAKSKNGIAYTLTLETECLNKVRKRRKKIPPLEEIRIKVPCPSSKKKHKDKENFSKKNGNNEQCKCDRIICICNCHGKATSSKHRKDNKKTDLTLQEHLKKNRPDFIEAAESRRQVVNSKSEQEIDRNKAKIKFAEDNIRKNILKKQRKLFTEQQMRDITKRNYKKLPEVQEKINTKREQRLRSADKFIVDAFAKKIQQSVLKGKRTFPIDANVMCLPKHCSC